MRKIFSYLIYVCFVFCSCSVVYTSKQKQSYISELEKYENTNILIDAKKEEVSGNIKEAFALYQKCLKNDNKNDAAWYAFGSLYARLKKYPEAIACTQKAVELNPDNMWYLEQYADFNLKVGQYKQASETYLKLIKLFPNKIDYYYDLSMTLIYLNKLSDAIEVYDKIESMVGINDDISIQKEKIYLQLRKPDKAVDEIQKLINKFPDEVKYYYLLAELYSDLKQNDKAIDVYKNIERIKPQETYLHFSLGNLYDKQKEPNKAFDEYKKAYANPKLNIDSKVKLLLSNYYDTAIKENKARAYQLLDILIKTHPDDAKGYSVYADFNYRDKNYEDAKANFLKVINIDSTKFLVWEFLLYTCTETKDFNSLVVYGKRSIEMFPEQAVLYLLTGYGFYENKNYEYSVQYLNKGIELAGNNNEIKSQLYSTLGDAYYKLKNYKESDAAYDKCLEISPKNNTLLNNYSYYLSLRNEKLDIAEKMIKEVVDQSPNNYTYLDTYAWVLYKQKKYIEAKTIIEKAITNGGQKSAVIIEHYGDILYQIGDVENAVKNWINAREKGKGSDFLDRKINDKKLYE